MSNILLSYPRSGNHLMRYILEYITGLPTSGCYGNPKDKPIYTNKFPNKETPLSHVNHHHHFCFTKFHKIPSHYNNAYLKADPALILIVRDYKECIISHIRKNVKSGLTVENAFHKELMMYFKLLHYYDTFEGKKMIIYYEDLLTDGDNVLLNLAKFVPNIKGEYFLEFIKNKDHLFYLSSNGKNRSWGGTNSNGELNYHFNNASLEEKNIIILTLNKFRKSHTDLFKKYLKRYLEDKKEVVKILNCDNLEI